MSLVVVSANLKTDLLRVSDFYNTMIDYVDIVADYDAWCNRLGKFSFCQYPFLVSMGAKMAILEADARRQMDKEMKDAIMSSIYERRYKIPFLTVVVRREYILEDSLNQVSA